MQHLVVQHVRNLQQVDVRLHERVNLFCGDNAQGKTNLLETVALCCNGKPLRQVGSASELIGFGCDWARVSARFGGQTPFAVQVGITAAGKKTLQLDNKVMRRFAPLLQRVAMVCFVPDNLNIALGSASHRRTALDQLCSGLQSSYIDWYRQYEKALIGRNRLLKHPPVDPDVLQPFNQVLIEAGAHLLHARLQAVQIWLPLWQKALHAIFGSQIPLQMRYQATVALDNSCQQQAAMSIAQLQQRFADKLQQQQTLEKQRKSTLCGPHLDDVALSLADAPVRQVASRGQARSVVLALKLAHLQAISQRADRYPLLLLDDVMGELDRHHAHRLLQLVHACQAQTFMTTTHIDSKLEHAHGLFHVNQGGVTLS
ncbi:MAG: DNA replication and repair protein RecF [Myxococcota bacterium]